MLQAAFGFNLFPLAFCSLPLFPFLTHKDHIYRVKSKASPVSGGCFLRSLSAFIWIFKTFFFFANVFQMSQGNSSYNAN